MDDVWKTPECKQAFHDGIDAASRGSTRNSRGRYLSYNERAAFNDGWDTYTGGASLDRVAAQGRGATKALAVRRGAPLRKFAAPDTL